MKRAIIFVTLIICTFSCCKKKYEKRYPEDTENTYNTPEERVINKWWVLDSVFLNGVDYTDTVYNKIGSLRIYLGEEKYSNYFKGYGESDYEANLNTLWKFSTDKEYIGLNRYPTTLPFILPAVLYIGFTYSGYNGSGWKVLKLSNDEIKISLSTKDYDSVIVNKFKLY